MTPSIFSRSFWILLFLGLAVRCVALHQPLLDAHMMRQCQTAAVTKSMIVEPGLPLSAKVPWIGDFDARFTYELPAYNYLVIGMYYLTGNLDLSGKLTTILLWAASFLVLQAIWQRLLKREQVFWANLLFVVAPLEVFFGQAFMPEMLVQVLAFGFVVLLMRHEESPTILRWIACAGVGLAGLLVKLPEIAHLYLILMFFVLRREGWKGAFRPHYLIAAAITVVAVNAWGNYMDAVNQTDIPEWTSQGNLQGFIGPLALRLDPKPWAMIFLYLAVFVVPGPAIFTTVYGLIVALRERGHLFLTLWIGSLAVFYVVWFGNGASAQNYYNLPALGPICALFGIGMHRCLSMERLKRFQPAALGVSMLLVVLPAIPVWRYLFTPDRHFFAVAQWVQANTRPEEVVLFRPNHHWAVVNYPYSPAVSYYSGRPTFVWTGFTKEEYRKAALERARYAVVTLPPPAPTGAIACLNRFRGVSDWTPEPIDWLETAGFRPVAKTDQFLAFKRDLP